MRRILLEHPRVLSLMAAVAGFLGIYLSLGNRPAFRGDLDADGRAGVAAPRTPADPFNMGDLADVKVAEWISAWESEAHSNGADDVRRDARQSAQLIELLGRTTLDGSALFQTAQTLLRNGKPSDEPLAEVLFKNAMEKAEQALARLTPPDKAAQPYLTLLWRSEKFEPGEGDWGTRQRIYETLLRWEPPGSDQLYRARLKYAEALGMNDQSSEAIKVLDSLIADVQHGQYSANQKDIAETYWVICLRSHRAGEGLAYLRGAIERTKGTFDERRLTGMLIGALADTGRVNDAKTEFGQWKTKFAGLLSQETIEQAARKISDAERGVGMSRVYGRLSLRN